MGCTCLFLVCMPQESHRDRAILCAAVTVEGAGYLASSHCQGRRTASHSPHVGLCRAALQAWPALPHSPRVARLRLTHGAGCTCWFSAVWKECTGFDVTPYGIPLDAAIGFVHASAAPLHVEHIDMHVRLFVQYVLPITYFCE